jgi:hypothetical protein
MVAGDALGSAKCLRKSLLVEGVYGVAGGMRVASQLVSELAGIFASGAGDEALAERRKVEASVEDAIRPPGSRARRHARDPQRSVVSYFRG